MKLTIEVNEADTMTIPEIIEKLGLQKFCQNPSEGNPLVFSFKDENGCGSFYLYSGDIEYDDKDDEDYNYYERELGSCFLGQALDVATLIWCETEDGETVAYIEG